MNFLQYYDDYKNKIYSYFYYNIWLNKELAEDLTSDTFLKCFDKFESYNDDYSFSTWIYTIAKNTLYDHYRKQKNDISLEEKIEQNTTHEFISYEIDFLWDLANKEKVEEIKEKLWKLNEGQREIIVMKYIEEYTNKEIAEKTGKTEANIRKILSRWVQKLKDLIQKPEQ